MRLLRSHPALVPALLLVPGLAWLGSFYLAPNLQMFASSFWNGTLETGFSFSLSNWVNYPNALSTYQEQYVRSIQYGFAATLLCFSIAFPLAYYIAFKAGRARSILLFLVVAPFFTSYLLRTIGWRTILGDDSVVLGPLKALGLIDPSARILDTPFSVVAGIAYNFIPFMILPIYVSLEKIDRRLLEAAQDLYASSWGAFRRITLPLAIPGIFAGSLLTFIPAIGDFINAELLGNPGTAMIGNVIQRQFLVVRDYPTAAALSFMLMVLILAGVALYGRLLGTDELTSKAI
ncbi:MAG: ABC transporter permease [Chloroflexi bacterium]|jgi:spermidine/putrescine transport system permease protein|nr:MAG: ABC transporter permease [Chloroflexota bacterium]